MSSLFNANSYILQSLFNNYLTVKLQQIAYNVQDNWHFAGPKKQTAKRFTGTKKCGGMRRGNGFRL